MQVNRTRADDAPARQRHFRAAQPPHQRTEQGYAGAHLPHQRIGGARGERARGELPRVWVRPLDRRAEVLENLRHEAHVAQVRHILDHARLFRQQRSRKNGQAGVFRPADGNFAPQRAAALNTHNIHDEKIGEPRRSAKTPFAESASKRRTAREISARKTSAITSRPDLSGGR
jgi:hypothetical protein